MTFKCQIFAAHNVVFKKYTKLLVKDFPIYSPPFRFPG